MSIEAELESYICSDLLHERGGHIGADQSLIRSGLLDSLTILQLISFLEERFGITVNDTDMDPDNFQTLNQMKVFIQKKLENN